MPITDWFQPMVQIGATALNGSTWFDRTNYFETVPLGALGGRSIWNPTAWAICSAPLTPEKLANQIGVVQNEKRQNDKPSPLASLITRRPKPLFPASHPYGHSTTIGSMMADLSAASLTDVRQWFRDHYGPNNAVIVLAGDIDARTARPLVENISPISRKARRPRRSQPRFRP